MGRPILFQQQRIGLNGRRFGMLKFRTMVKDAEAKKAALQAQNETGGATFKMKRDPRITPLGRFLRRSSIDELPQLLNVLTGSMSLVGPRPLPVDEQQAIEGAARRRLAMRPGITGLWQVEGRCRGERQFDQVAAYDRHYIRHWSLMMDLSILVKTIPVVLGKKGAC
jgi:lipopolysaccharide/colanic/teichoic acid biosynthesis glycosyltransferase